MKLRDSISGHCQAVRQVRVLESESEPSLPGSSASCAEIRHCVVAFRLEKEVRTAKRDI